jgi:hypothetical protein
MEYVHPGPVRPVPEPSLPLPGLAAKAIPELGLAACAAGVVVAVAATDRLPGLHPPR